MLEQQEQLLYQVELHEEQGIFVMLKELEHYQILVVQLDIIVLQVAKIQQNDLLELLEIQLVQELLLIVDNDQADSIDLKEQLIQ